MPKITLADTHLLVSASVNAERAALSLFSTASAIYPGRNENLVNHFLREGIEAGITLGLHARKIVELCRLEDVKITETRWKYDPGSNLKETSFREAANRFVHAKQLRIRTLLYPETIFGNDIVMTDFIITTDQKEEKSVDIFGFAWAYLSKVAPQIGTQ